MTLNQLKYAACVAELNSFNAASKRLFISQSSISTAIKDLEDELGIEIFARTNRGISLTAEGSEFIYYAKNILMQMNELEERYTAGNSKQPFSVTMHHSTFATQLFAEIVSEFGLADYEYSLYESRTADVIDNVAKGKSELGILYLSEYNRRYYDRLFKEHKLEFNVLADFDVSVYLGRQHPLADRKNLTLSELEEYPCLLFDQGENSSYYFYEEIISEHKYKNVIRLSDRATNFNLLKLLNGYSVGIGMLNDEADKSDFVAIRLETDEKIKLGILSRSGAEFSKPGNAYIKKLTEYLKIS